MGYGGYGEVGTSKAKPVAEPGEAAENEPPNSNAVQEASEEHAENMGHGYPNRPTQVHQ